MSQSGPLDDISERSDESGKGGGRSFPSPGRPLPPIGSRSASGASFTTGSLRRGGGETEEEVEEKEETSHPPEIEVEAAALEGSDVPDISAPERRVLKAFDGLEHEMVSFGSQTEWSWMEDMRNRSVLGGSLAEALTEASASPVLPPSPLSSLRSGSLSSKDTAAMSSRKGKSGKSSSRGGGRTSQSQRSGRSGSTKSGKAASVLPPYPEPKIDDEFGIPLADSSDESEMLSDMDEDETKGNAEPSAGAAKSATGGATAGELAELPEEDEGSGQVERQQRAAEEGVVAGVGPPQILQYLRESALPASDPTDPNSRIEALRIEPGAACQFCGQAIAEMPSLEDQANRAPEELFCCSQYRELLDYALKHPLNQEEKGKLIDIKPHPPHGNQKARREAKERAEKRMRERELARQQASMLAAQSSYLQAEKARKEQEQRNTQTSVFPASVARQMKTINYQLSSMKCLDEGWTLRAPSPLGYSDDPEMFELDATAADRGNLFGLTPRVGESQPDGVFVKFYPNKRKFLTLFEDGTGNIFYPSGNLAILMTRTDLSSGLVSYFIFEDAPTEEAVLLAVFDTAGHGTCYFQNGNIRLSFDPLSGIELDQSGNRRRAWLWSGQLHVHAPPFQPLCFALNRVLGLRMTSREQVALSFNTSSRSCKINVGAKLKLVNPSIIPKDSLNEERLRLEEIRHRIAVWLEKADNVMRHPNHPRLDKLPTSLHLKTQKEKLETQRAKLQARQEAAVK